MSGEPLNIRQITGDSTLKTNLESKLGSTDAGLELTT